MALNPLSIFSEAPPPASQQTVTGQIAPQQVATGQQQIASGEALQAGGQSLLSTAAAGKLTKPQQAQLDIYKKNLENTALQTYEGMGINPNKSTSYISTQEDIDQHVLAMSQEFVRSTIALAGVEMTAGTGMVGLGGQFESAAATENLQAAQEQIQQDAAYSKLIGDTFANIAKMAAAIPTGGLSLAIPGGGGGTYEGNINTPANSSFG